MIRRRHLLWPAIALPAAARAQQARALPRLAFITPSASADRPVFRAFRARLAELGWVDGQTIDATFHPAATAAPEQIAALVGRVVASGPDLIVADGRRVTASAAAVTRGIPVLGMIGFDPVEAGLVASYARPGGNVSGITMMSDLLNPKRLETMREIVPNGRRFAVIISAANISSSDSLVAAGLARGFEMPRFIVADLNDIDRLLTPEALAPFDGVISSSDSFLDAVPAHVVARINAARRPAVYPDRSYAEAGGLVSYGVDLIWSFRRLAEQVDRVLRGAAPALMPFERSDRFEMVVNLGMARQTGVALPASILARADEVIE